MALKPEKSKIVECIAKARDFINKFKPQPDAGKMTDGRQKEMDHALLKAAIDGKDEEFERLLKAGADIYAIDSYGRTALIFAASHGNAGIARLLTERIEKREYIDAADALGRTALIYAAAHDHTGICVILLKKGANMAATDAEGKDAVTHATLNGHIGTAGVLRDVEFMDQDERRTYLANLM